MGHIELAVPVLHAWYKASPSGGVNQLLGLSANEIDKVLSFVKYILVQKVDPDFAKKIKEKIQEDYDVRLKEIEGLYKNELTEGKENSKQQKDTEKLYEENKLSLEKEFNRIKSIISDLEL